MLAPRTILAVGAIALLAALRPARADGAGSGPERPIVGAVLAIDITVGDLDRAVAFYTSVLDFRVVEEAEVAGGDWERLRAVFPLRMRTARLRLGEEEVMLTECLAPEGRPIPADARSNDASFQHIAIVVSDMDRAYARLREAGVRHASSGPQRLPDWNPNAGGIEAFYFKDPEGHVLEVIRFPEGKGDPRWRRAQGAPGSADAPIFLGVDHTAIVVRDTEASLRFYRDALGLTVAGASENHGPEQERLNAVFGARLRITALRAAHGPGVELLEYLAPSTGRPADGGACACDLAQWRTRFATADAAAAERAALGAAGDLLSPGVIRLEGADLGFTEAVLLRDPDGHAIEFVEPVGGLR